LAKDHILPLKNQENESDITIAKQFRDVHFGGNWTDSSLKQHLSGITWQQAATKVYSFNTIIASFTI
jgi:hypothetical protein